MALRDVLEFSSIRRGKAVPAVIALIVAGLGWFGIQRILAPDPNQPASAPDEAPQAAPAVEAAPAEPAEPAPVHPQLLVAARSLGAGVMLTADLVEWREWAHPIDLNTAVLRDAVPQQVVLGSVTRRPYPAGTPIGWDGVITPGAPGFIGAVLSPGMRAITVEVDRATTNANIIYPGDRVDVIMVSAQQGAEALSQAIVRNVRVLAVGSTILSLGRYGKVSLTRAGAIEPVERPAGENYTLELLPVDAERVALAVNSGRLTLAMRSVNALPGYAAGSEKPVSLSEVLTLPAPPPAPPPPPDVPTVRIIRGNAGATAVAVDS